jgi:hypothetical protein
MKLTKSKLTLDLRLLRQELMYLDKTIPETLKNEMYKELLKSIKDKCDSMSETIKNIEVEEYEEENEEN